MVMDADTQAPAVKLDDSSLYGTPEAFASSLPGLIVDLMRFGALGRYIWHSRRIRGWVRGAEAVALARASQRLSGSPVIVEVGSFLGCSTVLLAGARKLLGSGHVYCIDPFAAGGDAFSVPIYQAIAESLSMSLYEQFERHINRAGLTDQVAVLQMTAVEAAASWDRPIDMLYLDGDNSPAGARTAYLAWSKFLKPAAVLAINNSAERQHPPGHDGPLRVVEEFIHAPDFCDIQRVEDITFAVRTE